MKGPVPFLFGWLPGRGLVGSLGDAVLSQVDAGMDRQVAQIAWVVAWTGVAFFLLRTSLRLLPRLAPALIWVGSVACRGIERLLLWIDYRIVTAVRSVGLTPLYWTSESVVTMSNLGIRVISMVTLSSTALGRRRAGWIAFGLTLVSLVTWDLSVCVAGAEPGCVPPHLGWWRFTSNL